MRNLLVVTIIWSFSFGLIGHYLVGKVDTFIAIFIRFFLGFLTLVFFTKKDDFLSKSYLKTIVVGAFQVGLMYVFYFESFKYLQVSEVALFTTTTPFYIYLFSSIYNKKINWKFFPAVLIAIFGGVIIKFNGIGNSFLKGLLFVQCANICFGLGQFVYKKWTVNEDDKKCLSTFSGFYLGAMIFIIPLILMYSNFSKMPSTMVHYSTLLWLGIVASGVCYYLWNTGGKKVSDTTLAVMNNAVIPAAVIFEFVIWKTPQENWGRFIIGLTLIMGSAFFVHRLNKLKS